MKMIKAFGALGSLLAFGILSSCSASHTAGVDITDGARKSLDQAGFKYVTVSQDREKGIVTLGGHVETEQDKSQAEALIRPMAGRQVIAVEIGVVPAGAEKEARTINSDLDKGIEKNLDAALIQSKLHGAVKYEVTNAVVTLKGEVESNTRRSLAEKVAAGVPNVKQVVNTLQVQDQKATSTK